MSSATLTMIGLYNFDSTLFDDITLPAGIDKDVLIPEILRQCGEFEVLYPNLEYLKFMISNWSDKHYRTFEKWVEGLAEKFNPLHNYDRYEEYTDTTKSSTNTSSNSSNERKVSAYDASSMQPREGESGASTGSGEGSAESKHVAHLYGNIGVTTSTQMLEDFLRVERWNIYEHIAELFVDEFCVRIY